MTEPIDDPTLGSRVRRLALPLVMAFVTVVGSFGAADGQPDRRPADWFMVLLLLKASLALYWLRTHPIPVLWATVVATLVYMLMQYPYGPVIFPFIIAVFTNIRLGNRLAGWSALTGLYLGHVGGRMVLGINQDGVYQVLLVGTCFVVLGFVAELFRAHRDRVTAAVRTRKEAELRQAGEERLRIAQELHDVVAHHISLINVQASTALHLVDRQPEQAGPALVGDQGRQQGGAGGAAVDRRHPAPVGRVAHRGSRSPGWTGWSTWSAGRPRPASRCTRSSAANRGRCRPGWTGPRSGSSRSRSPTSYGMPRRPRRRYGSSTATSRSYSRSTTTAGRSPGRRSEGNGIIGMRERATALGGTLTATRTPTGGLRIIADPAAARRSGQADVGRVEVGHPGDA